MIKAGIIPLIPPPSMLKINLHFLNYYFFKPFKACAQYFYLGIGKWQPNKSSNCYLF